MMHFLAAVLVFTFVLSTEARSAPIRPASKTLYDPNDISILQLDTYNFTENIYGKVNAFVVEYYASWCGHCQRFVPIYVELAHDMFKWKPVVQLVALNCADEINTQLCRDYEVLQYPTVKFYWTHTNASDLGQHLNYTEKSVENIRRTTIDYLVRTATETELPCNWPNFVPMNVDSKDELMQKLPDVNPTLVIVEPQGSYTAAEAILDLSMYKDDVHIYRVFNRNNLISQLLQRPVELPALLYVTQAGSVELLGSSMDRKMLVGRIKELFLPQADEADEMTTTPKPDSTTTAKTETGEQLEVSRVYMADLYNAMRYTLYQEVTLNKVLNLKQIDIVRRFTSILSQYFPFDGENPRRFCKRLTEWLGSRKTNVSIDDYLANMRVGSEGFLPPMTNYIGCKPSQVGKRGHPCSMWTLFHLLTVAEYSKGGVSDSSHTVLLTMRDYITNFFSCKYCAEHFGEMAVNLTQELTHKNSSVLWLWRAHNTVNARLKGDASEDPKFPKVQFPPSSMCPTCYTPSNQWNEPEVLRFLQNQYHKTISK